jgi:voltage-gated potassium channel
MKYISKLFSSILKLRYTHEHLWPMVMGFFSLFLVFLYGIFIYTFLEGWSLLDSFYQVIITLSTVGFGEIHQLSDQGRLHTSILICLGVGCFAYLIGSITQYLVEGRLEKFWEKRKMQKYIDSLENHYIVCGYGRIGSVVTTELMREGCPTVVIESQPEVIEQMDENGVVYVAGDATSDTSLMAAGMKRAKAIISTLDTDAENLYVTLTAKQLVPHITVIARAAREDSIQKLEYAGADRVLTPHVLGGLRMAQLVLRPTVTNFLDLAIHGKNLDLQMEELLIPENSPLAGKNLIESDIRPNYNLIVIAIQKSSGKMYFNPQPVSEIEAGDTLVVVGKRENLDLMQRENSISS